MRPTTKRFTPLRVVALCAAAALSLAAACEARVPTSAEIQSMDVASAERVAQKAGLMTAMHGGATPEFYVNDVKVTAEEAHAIAPNDIATVNVEKDARGGDASVIRIRTLAVSANGMKFRSAGPDAAPSAGAATGLKGLHEKMSGSARIFSGVILINGVRADAAAMHKLDPKDIASVEVVKGAAATAMLSHPAARNGIIKITTK